MTFEFIKSLDDIKSGVYYYQDNTGKIEICCYVYDLEQSYLSLKFSCLY